MILDFLRDLFNWHSAPPPFPQTSEGYRKSVSAEEAQEIFDKLAAREDIAFGYANDGCYARAHLMVRGLLDDHIMPKKAWAVDDGDEFLHVKLGGKEIDWVFHVAPVVAVEMPNGKTMDMVFDPSLFDGPVPLRMWGAVIHAKPNHLHIKKLGEGAEPGMGDYDPDEKTTRRTDKSARRTMEDYLPLQEPAGSIKLFESHFKQLLEHAPAQAPHAAFQPQLQVA